MNKIIVLAAAVLAMTGCAETANEGAYLIGGGGHAGGYAGDVSTPVAHTAKYEAPVRDVGAHYARHRDAEFVVCAQCRR